MADSENLVYIIRNPTTCGECGRELGKGAFIKLAGERGALCLRCAGMDHLVFLPSGDACVSRKARKLSGDSAVVLEWSRTRKRYERQGLMLELPAVEQAELECVEHWIAKARQAQESGEIRIGKGRKRAIRETASRIVIGIRQHFPHCPEETAQAAAELAAPPLALFFSEGAQLTKFLSRPYVRAVLITYLRRTLAPKGKERAPRATPSEVPEEILALLKKWERKGDDRRVL